MFFETRLSRYLAEILCNLKEKIFTVQSSLSLVLLSLLTGFLFGNLFGTLLDTFRLFFFWNGFVGFFILLLIEAINSLVYGIPFSKKWDYGNKNYLKKKKVPARLRKKYPDPLTPEGVIGAVASQIQRSNNTYVFKRFNKSINFLFLGIRKIYQKFSLITQSISLVILQKKNFFFYRGVTPIKRTINSFKIGLLFGFFVDSFKVGS